MARGDDLERLERDLATAERRMMGAASHAASESLRHSVDAGYELRQDVHGKAYKPAKDGHLPPMERSKTLRNAYRFPVIEGLREWLVKIIERTPYGQFLRDGTYKMERRQHVPTPDEPLPPAWFARMKAGIDAAVARVMS